MSISTHREQDLNLCRAWVLTWLNEVISRNHVYIALLHTLFHSKKNLIFKWEGNCHFDKFNITFTLLHHVTHLLIIFLKTILENKTAVTIFFSLKYSIKSKYKPRLFKLYHTFPELPPAVIQFRENRLVG